MGGAGDIGAECDACYPRKGLTEDARDGTSDLVDVPTEVCRVKKGHVSGDFFGALIQGSDRWDSASELGVRNVVYGF
jgi:hypothetical protein